MENDIINCQMNPVILTKMRFKKILHLIIYANRKLKYQYKINKRAGYLRLLPIHVLTAPSFKMVSENKSSVAGTQIRKYRYVLGKLVIRN